MSNKALSYLILLGFLLAGVLFYMYFFVYYNGSLRVTTNLDGYEITITPDDMYIMIDDEENSCPLQLCVIEELPPTGYHMVLRKDGYVSITRDFIIGKNKVVDFEFQFEREVTLEKQDIIPENEPTNLQKIESIKIKSSSYDYYNLEGLGEFSFVERNGGLVLMKSDVDLGSFPLVEKKNIGLLSVNNSQRHIYIKMGELSYLYDLYTKTYKKIKLKPAIKYIKDNSNQNEFSLVTEVGTFLYNSSSGDLEYFDFFQDFVYHEDGYVGVIYSNDKRRFDNLGLKQKGRNIVYYYNPDTKEKKLLYETGISVESIVKESGKIILTDTEGNEFELKM